MRVAIVFALLGMAALCWSTPYLNTYLKPEDKQSLKSVFTKAFAEQQQDISAIHHAVGGLKFLGESLSAQDSQKACEIAKKAKDTDAKELYHAAAIASDLPSCALSFPKAQETLTAVAKDDKATSQLIYYALAAAEQLKVKVDQTAFNTALQSALKKDDSALSLTYGLNAAVFFDAPTATKYFDRIEDLVGQADEIDGKYLQFEGGLSVTAGGVYAIYALSDKLNKSPAVKSDEAVKFASYLLNRKSVQIERAAFLLLRALKKLANNKYQVPVAFTLGSPVAVNAGAPKVIVKLSNVFGETVGTLAVNVDSATHIPSSGVVLSRKHLAKVAGDNTNTLYEFNLMEQPRERGFYKLSLSAGSQDKRLVGTNGAEVSVKVMTEVSVEDVEIAVFDREHAQATNTQKVAPGTKLKASLEADTHQKVIVKFAVKEKQTKKAVAVHQAFIAFVHEKTGKELIFVAEPDPATSVYKFDVDLQKSAKDFDGLSGKYNIRLIIGDSVVSNAIDWHLVSLCFEN
uniref:Dolichyl-diphosphooligosaccharide--protein glycosyltransferase subunit 2 n=1 Tax=Plectus sambesii TaxID=2011161 RepID=A0A914WBL8_9BILA